MTIKFTLDDTIKKYNIGKTELAIKAGIRNNTITDMCKGETKRIPVEALDAILGALEALTGVEHDVDAVFVYERK